MRLLRTLMLRAASQLRLGLPAEEPERVWGSLSEGDRRAVLARLAALLSRAADSERRSS